MLDAQRQAVNEALIARSAKMAKLDDPEIARILKELGVKDLADLAPELRERLTALAQARAVAAARAAGNAAGVDAEALGAMLQQANELAATWAEARAADLVTSIEETTRDGLRDLLERAVADGLTNDQISAEISNAYEFSTDRSDLIARTETSFAENHGTLEGWKASGVVEATEWLPDVDPCEECQANADQGPVPLGEEYQSGDECAPAHPRCECTNIAVLTEPDASE